MGMQPADAVVVITGASSGIGRAAAHAFAEEGARLVLAARDPGALEEAARECRARGGRAVVAPTDVRDQAAVEALARRAVQEFGRLDVWVNNASVTLFGRFEETPLEAYRAVLETNFLGYVHGARAALLRFREQGRGVLINIASEVAQAPQPFTSAYVTSKYAVRALGECLRMELALDGARDIHVCTVMPSSIDTPIFQKAANYTGRGVQPIAPVYRPEQVARTLVRLVHRPRRETIVGSAGRILAVHHALTPGLYERTGALLVDRRHFRDAPAEPTAGNLFRPIPRHAAVRGGWRRPGAGRGRRAALVLAAVVAVGAAALAR